MKINIVYEDNDLLIIDKIHNLCVHSGTNNKSNTLVDIIKNEYTNIKNVINNGIVHRLDKDTTGLIIIAKNNESYLELKKKFFLKEILKKYISIVSGNIMFSGTIKTLISRDKKIFNKMCVSYNKGKKSITKYQIIKNFYLHTLIYVIPITGRTHQIRLHMSYINHPIIGDQKYKNNSSNYKKSINFLKKKSIFFSRQALHSYKLIFSHPINKKIIKIKSKIPEDLINLINNIDK